MQERIIPIWLKILAVASALAFVGSVAFAAPVTTTPTGIAAADETVLRTQITPLSTTIVLEPLYKWVNGERTKGCIDTPAGFAVIEDVRRTEWISFGTKSCNSTTKITTLTDVRRGLSPTTPGFGTGTGLTWDASAKFRVIDYPLFYNNALYKDNVNSLTGSGQITGASTVQAIVDLPCVTTTQRDNFTVVSDGNIICNSTLGTFQYRAAGAWISFGSGSTINASESAAGKVQLATVPNMTGSTVLGTTGAPLVLQSRYATTTGSLAINKGWVGLLGRNGRFTGSLLVDNATNYSKSGAVVLNPATISGAYAVSAAQQFVPLSPIGAMMMWTTDTAPAGWLLADGKCHTRTGTGAALFAVIGTTFQGSCPANTFGVPDMRGRFALGQDDMGGSSANRVTDTRADTIGSGSGAATHTITIAEMPSHSHTLALRLQSTTNGAGGQIAETGGSNAGPTGSTGGGTAMDLMNPYITLNYIIRAR